LNHPDVHLPWSQWSEDQTLHWRRLTAIHSAGGPQRTGKRLPPPHDQYFQRRAALGNWPTARAAMRSSAGTLATFRCAPGGTLPQREHPEARNPTFPSDWKYGAWWDADFHFTRHDWALEAIHQLQLYDFVQCFQVTRICRAKRSVGASPPAGHPQLCVQLRSERVQPADGFLNGGWRSATLPRRRTNTMAACKRSGPVRGEEWARRAARGRSGARRLTRWAACSTSAFSGTAIGS